MFALRPLVALPIVAAPQATTAQGNICDLTAVDRSDRYDLSSVAAYDVNLDGNSSH
jgi:hypothetical protein